MLLAKRSSLPLSSCGLVVGPTKRTRSTRTRSGTLYSEYRHFATRSSTAGTPQAVPQHLRVRRAPSLGVLAPRPPLRRTASADRPARRPTQHPQRALSAALSRRAVPQHLRVRRAPSLGVLAPRPPPRRTASADRPARPSHSPSAASAQRSAELQLLGWIAGHVSICICSCGRFCAEALVARTIASRSSRR